MHAELVAGVHWTGFLDWAVRDFHGYRTERGSTYNAYLVCDTQTALIDTVKAPYGPELLARAARVVSLDQINYVVCNHAEPDHSGAMPEVLAACPNAVVVCNAKCREALGRHFDTTAWRFRIVKDGETLSLGTRTLQFFDTPMVHWPESMATYLVEAQILFSMDAFGQHVATARRFDDELPVDLILAEAKTYYANIVMPYGRQVQATLKRLTALPIRMVAPSHGVIWRSHIGRILSAYNEWAVCKPAAKVVVFFSTMWGSTRQMAESIANGAMAGSVDVRLLDLAAVHDTDLVPEIMDCACLAAGTATLNMGMMPRMAAALTYLRGLRPTGKAGVAFGSFGWASKSMDDVQATFADMQVKALEPALTVKYRPDRAVLDQCRALGGRLADYARTTGA